MYYAERFVRSWSGRDGRAPRQSTRSWRDAIQQNTTKILVGKIKFYQALHDEQFELQNPINFANYSPRLASSNWERWNNILEFCTESRFLKKQCKIPIGPLVEISRETKATKTHDGACVCPYCTSVQGICGHRAHEYWWTTVKSYLFWPYSSSISLLTSYKDWFFCLFSESSLHHSL